MEIVRTEHAEVKENEERGACDEMILTLDETEVAR